ncbi:MAG: hypothetical protein ACI81P_003358, partial [Neolewinella sp.]
FIRAEFGVKIRHCHGNAMCLSVKGHLKDRKEWRFVGTRTDFNVFLAMIAYCGELRNHVYVTNCTDQSRQTTSEV